MKNIITPLLVLWLFACISCHTGKKPTIRFIPIAENEFNSPADTANIPDNNLQSVRAFQRVHDSCMGMQFPANAFFMRTKDTISLGTIVNTHTMQVVKNLAAHGAASANIYALLNVMDSKPCYNKLPDNIPLDSFFRRRFDLELPEKYQQLKKELNQLLYTAVYTQAETGAWSYVELTDGLGKLLDTTTNAYLLPYKQALLQPDNMVLIRSGGVSDFTFHVTTAQPVSAQLKVFLVQKPFTSVKGWDVRPQLFYVDDTHIEVDFIGYFQVMGQFMRVELR